MNKNRIKGVSLLVILALVVLMLPVPAAADALWGSADVNGDGQVDKIYLTQSTIKIVYANNSTYEYPFNVAQDVLRYAVDTDGVAGAELVISRYTKLVIICDRTRSTREYPITSTSSWLIAGCDDLNGIAGQEVIITNGAYLVVVNEKNVSSKSYFIRNDGPWTIMTGGIVDTDGAPGKEIVIDGNAYDVKILSVVKDRVKIYTTVLRNNTVIGDFDGIAGAEVRFENNQQKWYVIDRIEQVRNYL